MSTETNRPAAPLAVVLGSPDRLHYARCAKIAGRVTVSVETLTDARLAEARKASCCKPVSADALIGAAYLREQDKRHAEARARVEAESVELAAWAADRGVELPEATPETIERVAAAEAEVTRREQTATGFAIGDDVRLVKSTYRWTVTACTDELVTVERTRTDGTTQTRTTAVVNAERVQPKL